jgi:hypothetical protein
MVQTGARGCPGLQALEAHRVMQPNIDLQRSVAGAIVSRRG